MNIALINCKSTFLTDPMVYPPLGLWYLAAQLENKGHVCAFYDLNEDKLPADGDFDQIWISATSSQMYSVREISKLTVNWKKTAKVLGGVSVWGNPGCALGLGFNLIVSGEADHPQAIDEILLKASNFSKDEILRIGNQKGVDHILPPVRRWANRYSAYTEGKYGERKKLTTIFTSRGCPMACAFCDSGRNGAIWNKKVRYDPLDIVEMQLDEIVAQKYKAVQFYDDVMPIHKQRTIKIAEMLKERDLEWRIFLRTDIISLKGGFEYLKKLHDCGLKEVCVGVESADNNIKSNIGKGTTIEQDTNVLKWCKEIGIVYKASIILGLPGETHKSLNITRKWLIDNKPDLTQVLHLLPFPGTPIAEKAEDYDLTIEVDVLEDQWYTGNDIPAVTTSTSSLNRKELQDFGINLREELRSLGVRLERK